MHSERDLAKHEPAVDAEEFPGVVAYSVFGIAPSLESFKG